MEQRLYERPRERIRARGAQSLSVAELLQVIIGSGSKNNTVVKLAKNIGAVLSTQGSSNLYNALREIPGVGDATACRILAALQLGKEDNANTNNSSLHVDFSALMLHKQQSVYCFSLDGQQNILSTHSWPVKQRKTTNLLAKQLFAKALSDGAHSVVVAIGSQRQPLDLGMFELSMVNDLRELSSVVQVVLRAVALVNKSSSMYLYGGSGAHRFV